MTRVLLVCTGNICRSPLAEAIMRQALAARGADAVRASSAGTGAWDGSLASEGALLVALEHGLDISRHRARLLTRELVSESDLILTMERHHLERVVELGGRDSVYLLGEYTSDPASDPEVTDPYGANLEVYRETFEQLDHLVSNAVERLLSGRSDADHGR